MNGKIAAEFVSPDGATGPPDRWRSPYRGDEMGEHRAGEPGTGRDG